MLTDGHEKGVAAFISGTCFFNSSASGPCVQYQVSRKSTYWDNILSFCAVPKRERNCYCSMLGWHIYLGDTKVEMSMSTHSLNDTWVNCTHYWVLILLLNTEVGLKCVVPLVKSQKQSQLTEFHSSIWEPAGDFPCSCQPNIKGDFCESSRWPSHTYPLPYFLWPMRSK